jgi:hypothetical protein
MSNAKQEGRRARARRHATRISASVFTAAVLCGYGAVVVALAAWERLRYGKRQRDVSVYPGLMPVRTPSDFASLDSNRST